LRLRTKFRPPSFPARIILYVEIASCVAEGGLTFRRGDPVAMLSLGISSPLLAILFFCLPSQAIVPYTAPSIRSFSHLSHEGRLSTSGGVPLGRHSCMLGTFLFPRSLVSFWRWEFDGQLPGRIVERVQNSTSFPLLREGVLLFRFPFPPVFLLTRDLSKQRVGSSDLRVLTPFSHSSVRLSS